MAKKYQEEKKEAPKEVQPVFGQMPPGMPQLTKEQQKKLEDIKKRIDIFQKELMGKFEDYIVAIGLLPPPQPRPGEEPKKEDQDKIHLLILVDDTDSTKMSKLELKDKLIQIIDEMAKKTDERLVPNTFLVSELWMSCYDGKYDILQMCALAAPVFDKGLLAATKIG